MPRFSYTIKDSDGKTITDSAEAFNRTALVQQLQQQGYFIVTVRELGVQTSPRQRSETKTKRKFSHKKIKLDDLLLFTKQLTTLLDSGVTLLRGLEVIVSQIQSAELFKVVSNIKKDVEQGSSFNNALAKYPKVFDPFWCSLIEVGEASGSLPTILEKLNFYLEQQAKFKATIISAIIYPCILFVVCIGAIVFFALVVGPNFENVFKTMGVELPLITISLLATFRFIKTNFLLLIGAAIGIAFLIKKYLRTYHGKVQAEKILLGLPVFGEIYKNIIVERFSSQMAILIESGVPILLSLDICQRLVNNNTCALIINQIKEGVREGELLVAPMERNEFFPPMAIQMIRVGEETGELSKMLNHVANYYQNNVEEFMKRFGVVIEPIMLVFMGVIIGVIVLAMFMPMFNITQLVGGGGGG